MPKIPQREESVRVTQTQGIPDIRPSDPTGGLAQVARVSEEIRAKVERERLRAKYDADEVQRLKVKNGLDEVAIGLASGPDGYERRGIEEVISPDFESKWLEKFDKEASTVLEGLPTNSPEYKRAEQAVAAERNAFLNGMNRHHISVVAAARKREAEAALSRINVDISAIAADPDGKVDDVLAGIREGLTEYKDEVIAAYLHSDVAPGDRDRVLADERGKSLNDAIRAAVHAGRTDTARAILAVYRKDLGRHDTINDTSIDNYINRAAERQDSTQLFSELITELGVMPRNANGKLSHAQHKVTEDFLLDVAENNPDLHDAVEAKVRRWQAADNRRAEAGIQERVVERIKEVKRQGFYEPTQQDFDVLGSDGVRSVEAAMGMYSERRTLPGAIEEWALLDPEQKYDKKWIAANRIRFSEQDVARIISATESWDRRETAGKYPGELTRAQSEGIGKKVALMHNDALGWFTDRGSVDDPVAFADFQLELSERLAVHGEPITQRVVEDEAKRLLALGNAQLTVEGKYWGTNKYNLNDPKADVDKAVNPIGDLANALGVVSAEDRGSFTTAVREGFGLVNPNLSDAEVDRLVIHAMKGELTDESVAAFAYAKQIQGGGAITLPGPALVPIEFRKKMIAEANKRGIEWTESMIEAMWQHQLSETMSEPDYGEIGSNLQSVFGYALWRSENDGGSIQEWMDRGETN